MSWLPFSSLTQKQRCPVTYQSCLRAVEEQSSTFISPLVLGFLQSSLSQGLISIFLLYLHFYQILSRLSSSASQKLNICFGQNSPCSKKMINAASSPASDRDGLSLHKCTNTHKDLKQPTGHYINVSGYDNKSYHLLYKGHNNY